MCNVSTHCCLIDVCSQGRINVNTFSQHIRHSVITCSYCYSNEHKAPKLMVASWFDLYSHRCCIFCVFSYHQAKTDVYHEGKTTKMFLLTLRCLLPKVKTRRSTLRSTSEEIRESEYETLLRRSSRPTLSSPCSTRQGIFQRMRLISFCRCLRHNSSCSQLTMFMVAGRTPSFSKR